MSAVTTAWRLVVDRERCIGSGMCAGMSPEHFRLVDGVSVPSPGPLRPDESVVDAAESCPVEAILVRDDRGRVVAPLA